MQADTDTAEQSTHTSNSTIVSGNPEASANENVTNGLLKGFSISDKLPKINTLPATQSNNSDKQANGYREPQSPAHLQAKCHGKIADLEQHVPEKWWTSLFADSLYLKTDGDCVEDPLITRHEATQLLSDKRISTLFASASPTMLDLCCGQGRHSVFLAQRYPHVQFFGHDQSKYLINLAIQRSSQAHYVNDLVELIPTEKNAQTYPSGNLTNTTFSMGDCQNIPFESNIFDLILVLGNSFGYFPSDEGDIRVLTEITRVSNSEALLVIDLTDGDYMRTSYSPRSWEWIDDATFACRERQLSKDGKRLISREVVCVDTVGVIRDQFYQERLYGRKEIEGLMKGAGFECEDVMDNKESEIVIAASFSQRNQDLGMMEQRLLVRGQRRKVSSSVVEKTTTKTNGSQRKPLLFPQLSVLLGDASKPCFGKLNDTWNKEDIITRDKLVEALYSLGYTASTLEILSNHDTLIQSLSKNNFPVFNLCDEGFKNDALSELHVPALLEVMGRKYSGAGPTCLSICYDKGLVSRSAEALGIPIPVEVFICDIYSIDQARSESLDRKISYPSFVKPMKGDNSLGITTRSKCNTWKDISDYLEELKELGIRDVICQEYLSGTEYSVGMIGNSKSGFKFLPILEVDYSKLVNQSLLPILGYESKWQPDSPYWTDISFKRAEISQSVREKLEQNCKVMWDRFECRDYARFDFRSDGSELKLLEANPNPGWGWDGKFCVMAGLDGINYCGLIEMILEVAYLRISGDLL